MSKKIGFVGCGNMGGAMVGGLINSGFLKATDIIISTKTETSAKKFIGSIQLCAKNGAL